jgi:hypothetical protein
MISPEEFRPGELSVPAADVDDLSPHCLACGYLAYKEFSVGHGLVYYFCGYYWQDKMTPKLPPCLAAPGGAGKQV